MWWDGDIDAVMARTARRPIPSGRVEPGEALALGLALAGFSVMMLGLFANLVAAGAARLHHLLLRRRLLDLAEAVRRRRTSSSAAPPGRFPPMIGWAVATGGRRAESVAMFLLIFLWTPPHFWALALFRNDDYARAGVPMLPVDRTATRSTRNHILGYAAGAGAGGRGARRFSRVGGPVYLAGALVLNAILRPRRLGGLAARRGGREADRFRAEKRFFGFSILYMTLLFALLLAEAVLRALGSPRPAGRRCSEGG